VTGALGRAFRARRKAAEKKDTGRDDRDPLAPPPRNLSPTPRRDRFAALFAEADAI
jgi:hypothetical protein